MSDEEDGEKRRPGRPATGETAKRQIRIGREWDRAERLALQQAELDGTVREHKNRATGETERKGDMVAYVTEALRRHSDRVERLMAKREGKDR